MAVDVFYTTVINTSGVERAFGFLGKHGMRLAAGEQITMPGNLASTLAGDHRTLRKFKALDRAVAAGALAVIKTPATFLYDGTATKVQVLTAGALGVALPSARSAGPDYASAVLTAAITAIPDGTVAVATATITFSAPVSGFNVADLVLTRGGSPVPLTGVTVTSPDRKVFTVAGLAGLTATNGNYVLTVPKTGTGIQSIFGAPLSADATEPWIKS